MHLSEHLYQIKKEIKFTTQDYHLAKIGIFDGVCCLTAATVTPMVQKFCHYVLGENYKQKALVGDFQSDSNSHLATVNGFAMHYLTLDDVSMGMHPTAILAPTLLAVAKKNNLSGIDVLNAYLLGFYSLCEITRRFKKPLHSTGWHPSGVMGTIAAAAALAHLKNLDAHQFINAVGFAAGMSSGIMENFGSDAKNIQMSNVSKHAIYAVELAEQGLTAKISAIDGYKGIINNIESQKDNSPPLQNNFETSNQISQKGISFKIYPICYSLHRVVDSALSLHKKFDLESIESIDIHIGSNQFKMASIKDVNSTSDAKYSVYFVVAAALKFGAIDYSVLQEANYRDPSIKKIIEKIKITKISKNSIDDPVFSPWDQVILNQKGGVKYSGEKVRFAKGHFAQGINLDDIVEKNLKLLNFYQKENLFLEIKKILDLEKFQNINDINI